MYSQPKFSVSQPPRVGPIEGAKVAVRANSAMPLARWCSGSLISVRVNARGISAPPVKPCMARNTIMLSRLQSGRLGSPVGRISASAAMVRLGLQVDLDLDRHARTNQPLELVVGGKGKFHRDALHHFGEVAGGVIRRQQAELRS